MLVDNLTRGVITPGFFYTITVRIHLNSAFDILPGYCGRRDVMGTIRYVPGYPGDRYPENNFRQDRKP